VSSETVAFQLKVLDNLIKKRLDASNRADEAGELTRMHFWIIGFLVKHEQEDVFQKDVENRFRISRSTTSSILSLMEKKGLLQRCSVPYDARLKKIVLLPKARQLHEKCMENLHEMEQTVENALSSEERDNFMNYIAKIKAALGDK